MLRPSSAMVAAALVAIPASAGIYRLATSSSTKTSEQVESPEESIQREARESDQELSKSLISQILGAFPYDLVNSQDERSQQIQTFVEETEGIRNNFQSTLNSFLLYQDEYTDKNIKDIIEQDINLTPIKSTEGDNYWSKLEKARRDEVTIQFSLDSTEDTASLIFLENDDIKESIKKFCEDPSEANSHLGIHSPTRTDKEKTKEYRLFTYYSYCTKESHYLSDKVNLWN